MIKIGIESDAYFRYENEKSGILKAKKHGYDCLDYQDLCDKNSPILNLNDIAYKSYLKELQRMASDAGIEFNQAHGLWPKDDTTETLRNNNKQLYIRQIKGCSYLGCKNLVIHPVQPYGWGEEQNSVLTFNENVKLLRELSDVASCYDVNICLENLPFYGYSLSKTENIRKVVDEVDCQNIKICFDVGHANVMKENIFNSIITAGEKLAVLHIHDNYGTRDDRHYIPFQGNIDWDEFIRGLNEIGYNGCMSLETVISMRTPEPMLENMQKGLAGIARYLADKIK